MSIKKILTVGIIGTVSMMALATEVAPIGDVGTGSLVINGADRPRAGNALVATVNVEEGSFVSYEWARGEADGAWSDASISTSATYVPSADDYEHWLRVVATMPNGTALTNSIFFSRLPVIYITGEMPTDIEQGFRDVQLRMQGNDVYEESYVGASQLKVRGNSTARWPKKPYKLKLEKKANPYGLGSKKNKHWVLLANYLDQSLMRNMLAAEIAEKLGAEHMKSTWVDVVANGNYLGNYQLCEHVRVAEDRVNIFDWEKYAETVADQVWGPLQTRWNALGIATMGELENVFSENFTWVNTGIISLTNGMVDITSVLPETKDLDLSGGYLYEMEIRWDAISKFWTDSGVRVNLVKPEYAVTSLPMINSAVALLNAAEIAWQAETGFDPSGRHYAELADLDSMVAVWLVNEIMGNDDASRGGYLHIDKGGKITFGPVWDFDWGAGSVVVETDATGWKCSLQPRSQCIFKEWLKHADFRATARASYLAHRMDIGALVEDGGALDAWYNYLAESGVADTTRWLFSQKETFARYGSSRGFSADADVLKSYMLNRLRWLDEQFATDKSFSMSLSVKNAEEQSDPIEATTTRTGEEMGGIFLAVGNLPDIGVVETTSEGVRITITNDVSQTVQLTDDLGEVVLDLNGHSIVGSSGSAGIKIIHGDGAGTHLAIVDLLHTGRAMVCGGSWNWSSYVGCPGVDVAVDTVGAFISADQL